MNAFVLSTGRCGTLALSRGLACANNVSVGHETRCALIGPNRFDYPKNHVEVDNRLAWSLGMLESKFGHAAKYIWLRRDLDAVAASYYRRRPDFMAQMFCGMCMVAPAQIAHCRMEFLRECVSTADANIAAFVKDKPHVLVVESEPLTAAFVSAWRFLDLKGEFDRGRRIVQVKHNASK